MANVTVNSYSEDDSRLVLETVRKLISDGYVIPGGRRNEPVFEQRGPQFYNASGETIPAFAVMQITDTQKIGNTLYYKVDQYAESVFGGLLFNGNRDVADKALGVAQIGPHYQALGDSSIVTVGHLWGPVDAEWTIADNGGPYAAIGEDDFADDLLRVQLDLASAYTGVVTTEITAYAGTTFGTGVVTLETMGASRAKATLQTGINVANRFASTIAVDAVVQVGRTTNGRLIVTAEDCA